MKPVSFFLKMSVIFSVSVLLISCSTAYQQEDKELLESINTILILPAQSAPEKKEADTAGLETGVMSLNSALLTYFENKKYAKLVTTDNELFQGMPGGNRLSMVRNIGRKFDCDAVLTCNISRYVERKGKKYAIESPASVAFECKLIEVKTGRAACFLNFDETQQALTENLLTLSGAARRGFKWLTAEELLNDGFIKKLSTCPYVTR